MAGITSCSLLHVLPYVTVSKIKGVVHSKLKLLNRMLMENAVTFSKPLDQRGENVVCIQSSNMKADKQTYHFQCKYLEDAASHYSNSSFIVVL